MARVRWGRSDEDGLDELETKVTGQRTVGDNFGRGYGSQRTAMTEEGGEEMKENI